MAENEDNTKETGENPENQEPKKSTWGLATRFSSERQPPGDLKSAGWAKRRRNQDLARMLLGRKYVGQIIAKDNATVSEGFRRAIAPYFGMTDEEMAELSNEAAIYLKQIGLAIEHGDQTAAQAIIERAYGRPREHVDLTDDEGNRPQIIINQVNSPEMPEIKENENDINENISGGLGQGQ
jgi:hypothetical protein